MAANSALLALWRAMDAAGFVVDDTEYYVAAVEAADKWVFILKMDDGSSIVGGFLKATASRSADFIAHPYYEGSNMAAINVAFCAALLGE